VYSGTFELTFFLAKSPLAPKTTMTVLLSSECSFEPPLEGISPVACLDCSAAMWITRCRCA
jgi:hypothetical protein